MDENRATGPDPDVVADVNSPEIFAGMDKGKSAALDIVIRCENFGHRPEQHPIADDQTAATLDHASNPEMAGIACRDRTAVRIQVNAVLDRYPVPQANRALWTDFVLDNKVQVTQDAAILAEHEIGAAAPQRNAAADTQAIGQSAVAEVPETTYTLRGDAAYTPHAKCDQAGNIRMIGVGFPLQGAERQQDQAFLLRQGRRGTEQAGTLPDCAFECMEGTDFGKCRLNIPVLLVHYVGILRHIGLVPPIAESEILVIMQAVSCLDEHFQEQGIVFDAEPLVEHEVFQQRERIGHAQSG